MDGRNDSAGAPWRAWGPELVLGLVVLVLAAWETLATTPLDGSRSGLVLVGTLCAVAVATWEVARRLREADVLVPRVPLIVGGQAIVVIGWAVWSGQGVGVGLAIAGMSFAPLVMATVFAYTIRPTAHAILWLRADQHERAATQAAATAALAERDVRVAGLARAFGRIAAAADVLRGMWEQAQALLAELQNILENLGIADEEFAAQKAKVLAG